MSIRLRLTLMFSAILALTLIVFSVGLYWLQSENTLSILRQELLSIGRRLVMTISQEYSLPAPALPEGNMLFFGPQPQGPMGGDPNRREIMGIINLSDKPIKLPFEASSIEMPLSDAGMALLKAGRQAWETGLVSGERMLILNAPVMNDGQLVAVVQVARPLTERDNSLLGLSRILVVGSLVTILAALGMGWWLAGTILKPIQRITQTAQEIGSERNFTRRVEYNGPPDEFGRLATTFNNMLSQLEGAYHKVAHSLEVQRNFVTDVSHELRTPLTTIRGNISLLARDVPALTSEQGDMIGDISDETDRLIRLVNDLLTLARADTGRSLARQTVMLRPLLDELDQQTRILDPERRFAVICPDQIAACADRDALKQVLLILIDNALKHTAAPISVRVELDESRVQISVVDNGPGIPPERIERIFERFYRGEEAAGQAGFGLGLAIAKTLVEAQNGSIRVESAPSTGSTFVITIPSAEK